MKTRVVHVSDNIPGAVYIGRQNGRKRFKRSPWANPYKVGKDGDLAEVIAKYEGHVRTWLRLYGDMYVAELRELAGKPLACWCRHDGEERTAENACHGDVLIELIKEHGLESEGE